jgi:hypothetical protein
MLGTPPSCFSGDGEVTVYISGGTAPYYYQGSNGETIITFSQSHTFTGLTSGIFSVEVTDAGLCTTTDSTTIQTPNSFYVVSIDTTNSTLSTIDGKIPSGLSVSSGSLNANITNTPNAIMNAFYRTENTNSNLTSVRPFGANSTKALETYSYMVGLNNDTIYLNQL